MSDVKLNWSECGEEAGGCWKSETPIGDYVVYYGDRGIWIAELWGGPDKQGEKIAHQVSADKAKAVCLKHYHRIFSDMQLSA